METTVNTCYGAINVKECWDERQLSTYFELRTASGKLICELWGSNCNCDWYDLVFTTDCGDEMFNIPTLVSVIEDYIDEHNIHIDIEDSNVQMCCVLIADDTHCLSTILLVLDSNCEPEQAIDAISEKIWKHEDYGDPEDRNYDECYSKTEIRIKASKLWYYGTEFYAERSFDTTYRLVKNMQILK